MQNLLEPVSKRKRLFRHLLIFITCILCIFLTPKPGRFMYEFETGKTWQHADLVAPLSFAILKTDEEIENEKLNILENFKPIYVKNKNIPSKVITDFESLLSREIANKPGILSNQHIILNRSVNIINRIYETGIIELSEEHLSLKSEDLINVRVNLITESKAIGSFLNTVEAGRNIKGMTVSDTLLNRNEVLLPLIKSLIPDITYDKTLSEARLNELLNNISSSSGMISAGETVINQGNLITPEKYQILKSLKLEYERTVGKSENYYLVVAGHVMLILFLFLAFAVYIEQFQKILVRENKGIALLLFIMLVFVFASSRVAQIPIVSIYLIPFCIIPIVILAFFGSRIAFITHFVIILTCSLFVPNKFEFIIVQLLAGFTAILTMMRIRYMSHFFIANLLILFAYAFNYLGVNLIQHASLININWSEMLWFMGNFILTLLAYPLIYAFEKLFGYVSDITLLELGDVNNKLLRKLALEAPGTFQHSLQVANLSESVLSKIGGNALLARVASLYHDIGKLENPAYFIENQRYVKNPHDEISSEKSAKIIIEHVSKGVEIAKSYNLPKVIIDFIKTHHGTTRIEYFYQTELKKLSDENIDETKFRYPGPKPSSKETAVVMIVDSVEAASRSLKHPGKGDIENLVDEIIDAKLRDHQFEIADISLKNLKNIKEILKDLLKSLYHVRIEYPEEEKNKIIQ